MLLCLSHKVQGRIRQTEKKRVMLHEKCFLSCFLKCLESRDASVNPRLCMQVKAGQNQAD